MIACLAAAQEDRDADAVAACVAPDYQSGTPTHLGRDFTGREQVRRNWRALFEGTPDARVDRLRTASGVEPTWIEWPTRGTQTDGSTLALRGVAIFGVDDDLIQWGRIDVEPVQREADVTWEAFCRIDEFEAR